MELYKNIDPDNITYDTNSNISMIFIKYNSNPLVMQTCKTTSPQIDVINNPNGNKYYLDFDLSNNKLLNTLENIEKKIVNDIENNYSNWFNTDEIDDDNYKSFLNNDVFKTKLVVNDDNVVTCDITYNNSPIKNCTIEKLEDLLADSKNVKSIVQCSGIWNFKEKFGCSWKVLHLKLYD